MTNSTGHGGKREGAGRRAGTKSLANRELRDAARVHTTQALQTLISIMNDDEAPAPSRVAAANAVLDRAAGKVTTFLDLAFDIGQLPPADALKAIGGAVSNGDISPQDGQQLSSLVESRMKAVEIAEIEKRLQELEAVRSR